MHLQVDARAMLTVGPKLCKDKLMQAAGRMRQLGRRQSVFMVGTEEITRSIKRVNKLGAGSSKVSAKHVIQWAMHNTIESIAPEGLIAWASQGLHFCFTHGAPDFAILDEVMSLSQLYERELHAEPVALVHSHALKVWSAHRKGEPLSSELQRLVDGISDQVTEYGYEHEITVTGLDEECERELEKEVEMEKEVEVQVPRRQPAEEEDWDFSAIFRAQSASCLPGAVKLDLAIGRYFANERRLCDIGWSPRVYVSKNFFKTVKPLGAEPPKLSQYLRPVDVLIAFCSRSEGHTFLLLSEREADQILKLFWDRKESSGYPRFLNLAYARLRETSPAGIEERKLCRSSLELPMDVLVTLQLFAGDTSYETERQKGSLAEILRQNNARTAALLVAPMRGLQFFLLRSDLEVACT